MHDFGDIVTAMVTPFREDGSLDLVRAKLLARHLIANGSDSLVVGGTTGESPTLTHQEKLALFRAVKEAVGDRSPVIAATGLNNTADTIELTAEAASCGADGVMLVVPYYNKPSQEGLYQHFLAAARATSLPVMLYNIPGRTGVNLLPETVARLSKIENIVSIKEASGNLDQTSEILRLAPPDFQVYSGDDSLTLPMVATGARGVVSVASHLVGKELKAMVQALLGGRLNEARAVHRRLFPLFKALFIASNPVPVKAALSFMGQPVGKARLPLVPLSEKEEKHLQEVMRELGLLPGQ